MSAAHQDAEGPVESVPPEEATRNVDPRREPTSWIQKLITEVESLSAERDALGQAMSELWESVKASYVHTGGEPGPIDAYIGDPAACAAARAFLSSCPVPTPKPKDGEE